MKSPSADPGRPGRGGTVRITGTPILAAFFCVGLIAGWAFHYAKRLNSGLDPSVSWPTAGVVFFLAAFLLLAAVRTRQARKARVQLPSHRAVNLLVLGKASARVGAAVFGGYAGFALGYLRASVSVPGGQLVLVGLTCVAGLALALAGLALERACRINEPGSGDDPNGRAVS